MCKNKGEGARAHNYKHMMIIMYTGIRNGMNKVKK